MQGRVTGVRVFDHDFMIFHFSKSTMPAASAAKKMNASFAPKESAVTAGPGHTPPKPQPTPNKPEPMTSGLSIAWPAGRENFSPQTGDLQDFKIKGNTGMATSSAPPITNKSLGSHCPVISRNATTTDGSVMRETHKPKPKSAPAKNALKSCLTTTPLL